MFVERFGFLNRIRDWKLSNQRKSNSNRIKGAYTCVEFEARSLSIWGKKIRSMGNKRMSFLTKTCRSVGWSDDII